MQKDVEKAKENRDWFRKDLEEKQKELEELKDVFQNVTTEEQLRIKNE